MIYGSSGPSRIPMSPMPESISSAPKAAPNANFMRSQIAGAMSQPQQPQQQFGNAGPMRMMAMPRRF